MRVQVSRSNPKLASLAAIGAFALAASAGVAAAATVVDGSFEDPSLGAGNYAYGVENPGAGLLPPIAGLTFNNGSGIQSNGSAWGFAAAPDGVQTAFLQSYNGQSQGVITQQITGLTSGQSYTLTFDIANRPNYAVDPLSVSVGTSSLGTFTPGSTAWTTETASFVASITGTETITWSVGASPNADADIGLDDVSISSVPEPAAWALMLIGFAGLGGALRLRRQPAAVRA